MAQYFHHDEVQLHQKPHPYPLAPRGPWDCSLRHLMALGEVKKQLL